MKKEFILSEIIRTTKENNGLPLGLKRFEKTTGIKETDWSGKYWTNWGEALLEAGFEPNKMQEGYDKEFLIEKLIGLIQQIDKFPTLRELKKEKFENNDFPSVGPFTNRLGKQHEMAEKVVDYCKKNNAFPDVVEICLPLCKLDGTSNANEIDYEVGDEDFGFVYLMKSGKNYKIGKSKNVGRREYDIGLKLPEKLKVVHEIRTDDPSGIEAYWHNRFKDKRMRGEWFKLTSHDVCVFKRRKSFM